jgi:hypothetical protein
MESPSRLLAPTEHLVGVEWSWPVKALVGALLLAALEIHDPGTVFPRFRRPAGGNVTGKDRLLRQRWRYLLASLSSLFVAVAIWPSRIGWLFIFIGLVWVLLAAVRTYQASKA